MSGRIKNANIMSKIGKSGSRNKKKRSLRVQIPMIVTACAVVIISVMSIAFGVLTSRMIRSMVQDQLKTSAQMNILTLQKYLDTMNIYAQSLGKEVKNYSPMGRDRGQPEILKSLTNIINEDKVFSAYFAFEPNKFFQNTDKGLSYYVTKNGKAITIDVLRDYDVYSTGDYYQPVKETLTTHITEPYEYEFSDGHKDWLVSICTPILMDGKFVGVANVDILSESLYSLELTDGGFDTSYSTFSGDSNVWIVNMANKDVTGEPTGISADVRSRVVDNDKILLTETTDYMDGGTPSLAVLAPAKLEGTDLHWLNSFIVHKDEVYKDLYGVIGAVVVIGVIGLLAMAFITSFVVRRALAAIQPLMQMATSVGQFDLKAAEQNKDFPANEMGDLADVFRGMATNLKTVLSDEDEVLAAMANGDFVKTSNCESKYIGDLANTNQSISRIRQTLGSSLREISSSAKRIAENASQISGGAQALAQGATEQAGSIQELSSTISDVNSQVQNNATNAAGASEIARKTKEAIEISNRDMEKLSEAMDEIADASQKIQEVIGLIDNIAFQTNILSLNAAIEAARAGEAGKGFAVVADEVGNLANRSSRAAQSTSELITQAVESVERGKAIAAETAEALNRVQDYAQETDEMITRISEASSEQAKALGQITIGIDQISTVVQTNSSTSEESAAASIELSDQANQLENLVKPFKLS